MASKRADDPPGERGSVRLAPEGRGLVVVVTLVAAAVVAAALVVDRWPVWVAAGGLTAVALGMAYFFRDPVRSGPRGDELVLSAADGLVLGAEPVEDVTYLGEPAVRISVFLSLLDVHVNWMPVSGTVEWREDRAGGFEPAWRESASHGNASVALGIRREDGRRIVVRQVVGLVARRIVNHAHEGDQAVQGARMGIIRFGSRVDVFLPRGARIRVARGERAVGGVTVLAELESAPGRGESTPEPGIRPDTSPDR